jgi:hypothetical protein
LVVVYARTAASLNRDGRGLYFRPSLQENRRIDTKKYSDQHNRHETKATQTTNLGAARDRHPPPVFNVIAFSTIPPSHFVSPFKLLVLCCYREQVIEVQ